MTNNFSKIIYLFAASLFFATSCKKFVIVSPPTTMISNDVVFSNDAIAISSVTGLYYKIVSVSNYILNGALSVYPSLSGDDLVPSFSSSTYDPFTNNQLNSKIGLLITSFWRPAYNYIFQENSIIEGLEKSSEITPAVKDQLLGETKFLRALTYFYLVNLFGDVPLITSTDFNKNNLLPRNSSAQIYQQIITDLKSAQQLLPETYETTSDYPTARVRANQWAATALLARVYLFTADYADAEIQSSAVITSGTYSLEQDLNRVFLSTSNEAILQFMPVGSINTAEGYLFNPASGSIPTFLLSSSLLSAFESGDNRKADWTQTVNVSGTDYAYPYKYKIASGVAPYGEYSMILRYAEQFLIRAEARIMQDNLDGGRDDLNTIRSRADLTDLPTSLTKDQLLLAVEQERRVEFFAEFGHRWFDLKRTGRADAVLSTEKGSNWQSFDVLYPIPFAEIQANASLTQNDGYN